MINAACPRGFKLHVLQLQLLLNLFLLAFAKAAIVVAKPRGPKFFVFVPRPEDDQKLLLRLPPVFSHATTDVLNKKKSNHRQTTHTTLQQWTPLIATEMHLIGA